MEKQYKNAIREVLEYLKHISDEERNRINPKFLRYLEENAADIPQIEKDYNKAIYEIDFSPEAKTILAFIAYKYWSSSQEEKDELLAILNENEEKYEAEIREKYNPDNIFKNPEEKVKENIEDIKELITEKESKKSQSFFSKIINFFKKIFKK